MLHVHSASYCSLLVITLRPIYYTLVFTTELSHHAAVAVASLLTRQMQYARGFAGSAS